MNRHELIIEGVNFSHRETKILSDVCLTCRTGDIIGLFGRNGSGKSTLLNIIFGTLKAPDKIVRIDNKVCSKPYLTKNLISYLPQHGFLPTNITLKKIVSLYASSRYQKESILEDSIIRDHLQKTTPELSAGEIRYFEVLLLLSSKSMFVLLDDPFRGIEPIYQEKVKNLIISNKGQKGFIITDHSYDTVMEISNHRLVISKGRIHDVNTEQELIEKGYLPRRPSARTRSDQQALLENSKFEMDGQSFKDIELFDGDRNGALFRLFSSVKTAGGNTALMNMLLHPSNDRLFLEGRRDSIRFFVKHNVEMKLNKTQIEMIEYYLASRASLLTNDPLDRIRKKILSNDKQRNDEYIIKTGISFILQLLKDLDQIAELLYKRDVPDYLAGLSSVIDEFISTPPLHHFVRHHTETNHSDFAKLDGLFRNRDGKLKTILSIVYEMEVFQCLSTLINKNNFSLPEYAASGEVGIHLAGVFHPLLKDPVENSFDISGTKNLCLVTGANMAGKSTFLKAFSICVYLAHIGFPVPAKAMKTTVFNGLITTINLSDSISEGYSHFFAEVERIKQSSLLIKDRKRMVVVFDELFRGTNVKEAYEASLMITNAFSEIDSSVFLISTHIAEITGELQKRKNVFFNCFESELTGQVPTYNYLMKSGVSEERMGMSIIKNEKILEILKQAKSGEDLKN